MRSGLLLAAWFWSGLLSVAQVRGAFPVFLTLTGLCALGVYLAMKEPK